MLAIILQQRKYSNGVYLFLLIPIVLMLTLFAGWRADNVGADTSSYVERFRYLSSLNKIWDYEGSSELGYKILLSISLLISKNPTTFLILTSGLASLLYITSIIRYSKVPALALFTFISFGFYSFHMNGLRQGIALGVFMHAITYMLTGRLLIYIILTLIASLFHSSAILMLVVYPIFRLGFTPLSILIIILSSILTIKSSDIILQLAGFANERYILYKQRTETGGAMLTLFHVLMAIIFILNRKIIKDAWKVDYDRLLIVFLFGTTIYVLVFITGSYVEMNRIALYFTVSLIFLFPLLTRSFTSKNIRFFILIGIIFIGSIFYFIFLTQIGGYIPYSIR